MSNEPKSVNLMSRSARYLSRTLRALFLEIRGFRRVRSSSNDYWYSPDRLSNCKAIVDVGCADDADLSVHFLKQKEFIVYGVDPTQSHRRKLEGLATENPNFIFLPFALGEQSGEIKFFHNTKHQSGSLFGQHINLNGDVDEYTVACVDLGGLLRQIGENQIGFMKMDIEGAELKVLAAALDADILRVDQFYIEFHPHAFGDYDFERFNIVKKRFSDLNYENVTCDDVNILFYKR